MARTQNDAMQLFDANHPHSRANVGTERTTSLPRKNFRANCEVAKKGEPFVIPKN